MIIVKKCVYQKHKCVQFEERYLHYRGIMHGWQQATTTLATATTVEIRVGLQKINLDCSPWVSNKSLAKIRHVVYKDNARAATEARNNP